MKAIANWFLSILFCLWNYPFLIIVALMSIWHWDGSYVKNFLQLAIEKAPRVFSGHDLDQ